MDVTAQNPKVKDIWSTSGQPATQNGTQDDPQSDVVDSSIKVSSGGGFGRSGVMPGGESGGWNESQEAQEIQKAQELLAQARKQEAEHLAEVSKSPETPNSVEVGEKLKPAEVLRAPESQKPSQPKEPVKSSQEVAPQPQEMARKVVDKRTGKEKTHRVDINRADSVTKTADLWEQDFIVNVEKEHIKSIL